jgi:rhodanese-related sulfurtransferase
VSVPEVDADDARALVDHGALLLDVREPEEWEAGHAPEAEFVPLAQVPDAVDRLPRDRRIVVICRSGARSARATEFLNAQGFDAVNMSGGMKAWAATGFDVRTDEGDDGIVA